MASSEATWVELIDERTPYLMVEVAPTKLLPFLNLSSSDKENIICDERNKGKTEAALTLLEKLKKQNGPNGRKAFDGLVRALRNVGSQQSALLLDPHFKGKNLHLELNWESKLLNQTILYFYHAFEYAFVHLSNLINPPDQLHVSD